MFLKGRKIISSVFYLKVVDAFLYLKLKILKGYV